MNWSELSYLQLQQVVNRSSTHPIYKLSLQIILRGVIFWISLCLPNNFFLFVTFICLNPRSWALNVTFISWGRHNGWLFIYFVYTVLYLCKLFLPSFILLFCREFSCFWTSVSWNEPNTHESAHFVTSEEVVDPLWVVVLMVVGVWLMSDTLNMRLHTVENASE